MAKTQGVDDAEKLKRFLYDKWLRGEIAYVLLAGDADVLPEVAWMTLPGEEAGELHPGMVIAAVMAGAVMLMPEPIDRSQEELLAGAAA